MSDELSLLEHLNNTLDKLSVALAWLMKLHTAQAQTIANNQAALSAVMEQVIDTPEKLALLKTRQAEILAAMKEIEDAERKSPAR